MRYDAEHKARTREKVLRVASEAIRADGPAGVGVAQIMGRAGLTHGGFYAHFESKDALVADAIDAAFADARAAQEHAAEGAATPQDALRRYVRFYLSRSHRDGRATGCPVAALAADMPRLDPAARARFGAGVVALTAALAERLAACGRSGVEGEACAMISEMHGALSLARAVDDEDQSQAILFNARRSVLGRLGLDDRLGDAA